MSKYNVAQGKFPCHTCKEVVSSLRHYIADGDLTWICSQKHLSKVSLVVKKKTKKDYERAERS